jgi:hypothetical protein
MTGTVLWLGALAALSLAAAVVLRRVGRLAGGTHELERLKSDVVGINQRLGETVDELVGHLDEVRRGARDPAATAAEVEAARAALRILSRQAHELRPPAPLRAQAQELAWEVDRAVRAADMAGHGLAQMGGRRNETGTEAQTALKRGTLGLRHAREAVTRMMIGLAKLTPVEVNAMPVAPMSGRFGAIVTPPVDEDLVGGPEES